MQSLTTAQFQTMAEVNAYLGGDTVECLLCGKHFQCLSIHIQRKHGMLADDYRRQFGIPFTRSLTSARAREIYRKTVTPQLIEAGLRAVRPPDWQGPRGKGTIPAVARMFREAPLFNDRVTTPCYVCGAPVVTTPVHVRKGVRCFHCAPPEYARTREFRLRHHLENAPPVLTPEELRAFHTPFRTSEDAERYLSRDYIACLICGQQHLILDNHLQTHGISAADYRRRFGIPRASALCCPRFLGMRRALITTERLERFRATIAEYWRTGVYDHLRKHPRGLAPAA